jgi:hypothetical protein
MAAAHRALHRQLAARAEMFSTITFEITEISAPAAERNGEPRPPPIAVPSTVSAHRADG